MVSVRFGKNSAGQIFTFKVENHAKGEVCAAVSILTINTANSLEKFTEDALRSDYNSKGGYLELVLPEGEQEQISPEAELLLNSMFLGLYSIQEEYGDEIEISELEIRR